MYRLFMHMYKHISHVLDNCIYYTYNIHIHAYIYIYICLYIHTCMHEYTDYTYTCIHVYKCVYIYAIYMCVCLALCIYTHISIYIYPYIYTPVYVHMHIYIHTYTYITYENMHMGGCQNCGPLMGLLNTRCRIILRTQKGTIILTTTHICIVCIHYTVERTKPPSSTLASPPLATSAGCHS